MNIKMLTLGGSKLEIGDFLKSGDIISVVGCFRGTGVLRFINAILLLIFSVCSHAYSNDPEGGPVRDAAIRRKIACPARDFSKFIKAFSENKEIQVAFTKYPLYQQKLNADAEPEPQLVVRKLQRDQVSFPVMPNEAERKVQSLYLIIDKMEPTHVKLTLMKQDTDYKINYFFSLNSCWFLERIENWSL